MPDFRASRRIELRERLAGGFLLGGLLRARPRRAELLAVHHRGAGEAPVVRRAFDGELRVGHVPARSGEELLQVGLLVDAVVSACSICSENAATTASSIAAKPCCEEERRRAPPRGPRRARCGCATSRSNSSSKWRRSALDETLAELELTRHHRARRARDDVRARPSPAAPRRSRDAARTAHARPPARGRCRRGTRAARTRRYGRSPTTCG